MSEQLSPYCIVQPKDTAEVALAVTTLRASTTNWAVRGGGHMTWAGSANSKYLPAYPLHEILCGIRQALTASILSQSTTESLWTLVSMFFGISNELLHCGRLTI